MMMHCYQALPPARTPAIALLASLVAERAGGQRAVRALIDLLIARLSA